MEDREYQSLNPETAFARLQVWFVTKKQLSELKQSEFLERKDLCSFYFPHPVEGTNRVDLGLGYDLKLQHQLLYSIDEPALEQVTKEDVKRLKLNMDELIEWQPKLKVAAYRKLTAEQQAFVNKFIDVTDGSPQMEITTSKDTAGMEAHAAAAQRIDGLADPEAATEIGQYYEDGDGQWWIVTAIGGDVEVVWEECANPNPPVAPKRGRKKK